MSDEASQTGQGEAPEWMAELDALADQIAQFFVIVAGPLGSVLIGQLRGNRYAWLDASHAERHLFGYTQYAIRGEHKQALISRLRRRAHQRVDAVPLYTQSTGGRTFRTAEGWFHQMPGEPPSIIAALGDCYTYELKDLARKGTVSLGLNDQRGDILGLVGVLHHGDIAYPYLFSNGVKGITVPIPHGEVRHVIAVLQQRDGLSVKGFTVVSEYKKLPTFKPYEGDREPSYYPLHIQQGNKTKLRILYLP